MARLQSSIATLEAERLILLRRILFIAWAILTLFVVINFMTHNTIALWVVTAGTFVLTPMNLFLVKRQHHFAAKMFFIVSANLYIYLTGLAYNFDIHSEVLYIPAAMSSLLLFDWRERAPLQFSLALSVCFWTLSLTLGTSFVPSGWIVSTQLRIVENASMASAFILTIVTVLQFKRTTLQMRDLLLAKANRTADRYRIITETMSEGLLIMSSQGLILHHNMAAEKILGLDGHTLSFGDLSTGICSLIDVNGHICPPEDHPSTRALREGKTIKGQVIGHVLSDKSIRWIKVNATPTDAFGDLRVIVTFSDISEEFVAQKNLEAERARSMHNAKLASLGEMSAGIAHEINNPLAIIIGTIPLMERFKSDESKFAAKIEVVLKATHRIAKIVNGLRKFSRTTNGSDYKAENLTDLIHEALTLTEAKVKRHDVNLSVDISGHPWVFGDAVEVEQVIVNLINNAVDAIKTLPDRWIQVRVFTSGNQAVIRVIDSGPCIASDIEEKLFQPFFTTKKVGEGTGLGLSIVKGILDQHQASIAINRSFPTTCFEIRFKLSDEVLPRDESQPTAPSGPLGD